MNLCQKENTQEMEMDDTMKTVFLKIWKIEYTNDFQEM